MSDALILDLNELRKGRRAEIKSPFGHVIADPTFAIRVGKYRDHTGVDRAALSLADPALDHGEPRIYLITKEGALSLASSLIKIANEVGL
jgi:hypothetical protein